MLLSHHAVAGSQAPRSLTFHHDSSASVEHLHPCNISTAFASNTVTIRVVLMEATRVISMSVRLTDGGHEEVAVVSDRSNTCGALCHAMVALQQGDRVPVSRIIWRRGSGRVTRP